MLNVASANARAVCRVAAVHPGADPARLELLQHVANTQSSNDAQVD